MIRLIFVILFINYSIGYSQSKFINPFKIGNYYEYLFETSGGNYRYSSKIESDTIMYGKNYVKMAIYNEPPIILNYLYFSFDSLTLNIFGGENSGCPDSTGNVLTIGFNMPVGYIWNECFIGTYFRSKIVDKGISINYLNSNDTLNFIVKEDTIGGSVQDITVYGFTEKFGYSYFYRGYGNPLGGGAYDKRMVGAIIDGVTYGTILLDINLISNEIPSGFKLEQNFPNPFNPSTIIKFSVPKSSFVSLKIFDQLGKEISVLVNEKKSAGSYQYVFNANGISSGIYFYTLQTDDFTESKRMVLLK